MSVPVTLTDPYGNYVVLSVTPGATLATSQNQTTLLTAIGTPADVAWTGTGPATVIALLKAIAQNTSTT
jgi:hypothetical protein